MNFEELQANWRSQPLSIPQQKTGAKDNLIRQWHKQQRNVLWANIGTTAAFLGVFIVLGWVFISFHKGRTLFFSGSLLFMLLLLSVYLWVIWKGVANKKNDPALSSKVYIDDYLSKLFWRRRTITTYTWIYSILLWLAFMFYCLDITRGGSLLLQVSAPVSITLYIFGMQLLMRYTKQKKQLAKLDQLIADMQELKMKLTNDVP